MAMFGRHHGGHPFSDMLRKHGASKSGTSKVGTLKGAAPHSSKNPGGVAVHVPSHKSLPSKTPANMEGRANPVPRGGGPSMLRRGLMNSKRTPANIGESVRLANFGQPSGNSEKGSDAPFGGMERKGMPSSTPANMDGKAHKVKKAARGGKPAFMIGDAHHNHGTPKVGGKVRRIGGGRTRDLAAHL